MMMNSCTKENEEDIAGSDLYCLDSLVSYENNIRPILQNNCYECHSTAIHTNDIILDTYEGVTTAINNGFVLPQINRDPGAAQMPFGRPKLSDCVIATIEKWVEEGMLNN
jgi:hypothetical protein